jgi:hypothetical protein
MNETPANEKPAVTVAAPPPRDTIKRLHLDGYSNREIAAKLNIQQRVVGRNLREVKNRWARAATRQKHVLSMN